MAQYVLFLYDTPHEHEEMTPEQQAAHVAPMAEYVKALVDKGILRAGAPLAGPDAATTVRIRDDRALTNDGPFAETKEQLAGFFVIECNDLDEALEWAERNPVARSGGVVEVRPVAQEVRDEVNQAAGRVH